ncbi:MAG: DUF3460 family protein [Oxalicibacterium faecigallinarum]|uniref:DUF3460 family protein n=1 Tax=Oxalicibacterium faecigallinarum TaxID=573741 RepID=A0A8J3F2L3_9BURK|nr:DUF3460 family protein [Oxalicibacterium faecigallinarum]MDQ7969456.1 DUF3460 family protein [Oxalicibacterium faecigallinarum]GGI18064.1 hypothetical protein GCM10008066_12120 [Oxalicibacterium faecigallinarum]
MVFSKNHYHYQSEATKFIEELKAKNPHIDAGQIQGRALLWDKSPIDLDQLERTKESRVKQQAYVYQNKVR